MKRDIVLVRHGETEGRSSIRLYGATDIRLSDLGRWQMSRVSEALSGEPFDLVVTSPLSRAQESTRLIVDGTATRPQIFEEFREINFGDWEGWTIDEVASRAPDLYARFRALDDTEFIYPGGDKRSLFRARIHAGVARLLDTDFRRALAVLHKGVIKTTLQTLTGLSPSETQSWDVELGSIYRVEEKDEGWRVLIANDTRHLDDTTSG